MCIFCQIISKEIPSRKIMENEKAMAFLDLDPVNPGHALVIPKEHYQNLEDVSEESLVEVIKMVKEVGGLLKKKLGIAGYNVIENNDPIAGQVINHLHFHIIPRYKDDGLKLWQKGNQEAVDLDEMHKKIIN